ncbi:STAS domain-containing protein [Nonomuraea sp. NPDC002799]
MMQLSVRLVPVGVSTLVVALTGELDSTTRPVLAAFLDPLPQSRVKYVIVAAGDLWFCDLNGLKQFSITHHALESKGGYLAVAEAQPPLLRLIALMAEQAHTAIPVYTTMPEALADTDVEIYETAAPPRPLRRHLPSMRNVRRVRAPGHDRRRPQSEQPPVEPEDAPLPPVISRSRTLREQNADQRHTLTSRRDATRAARIQLISTRNRCGESLQTMLISLVNAQSAMGKECR